MKVSDKEFEPLSVTKNGIVRQLESVAKTGNNDNRKRVCKGDFVINSRSDRKQSCGLSEIDNLETIFQYGLLSRNEMIKKNFEFIDVADPEIIQFRKDNGLNDYVPFHFYPKNPFDGRVQKDNSDSRFAYICVRRNIAKQNDFKIIPRHPKSMKVFQMFDYDLGFEKIEWDVIDNWSERDYNDNNIRNICMAECITTDIIELDMIHCIAVLNKEDKQYIEKLLKEYNVKNRIFIDEKPNWFI